MWLGFDSVFIIGSLLSIGDKVGAFNGGLNFNIY
jgi:hypothetical protein